MPLRSITAALLLLLGCGEADTDAEAGPSTSATVATSSEDSGVFPGSDAPLIDLGAWELATNDPFPDRPDDVGCPIGFGIENGLFEVDTGLCPFGTFVQPSFAPVRVGDEVELIFVHDALFAEEEGAEAHVGLALGDTIGWETTIPIPTATGFFRPIFVSEVDAPRGTPVTLHIHNHGVNSYRFVSATVFWAE